MRRQIALLPLASVSLMAALTGCGQDAAVPDVVGMRLDKAHQALAAADFEDFEDRDFFPENRSILLDANWVVLAQDPEAKKATGTGTTITLRAGKTDEARAIELLPDGSPVLTEIRAKEAEDKARKEQQAGEKAAREAKDQAEEAAKQAKHEAARSAAILAYINDIDPVLRLAQGDLRQVQIVGQEIRSGKTTGDEILVEVADAKVGLGQYREQLVARTPDDGAGRNQAHAALLDALGTFEQAALTLLSANGPDKTGTLSRFDDVYGKAKADWNAALTRAYETTPVPLPLLG
jgi:hypothetical protein